MRVRVLMRIIHYCGDNGMKKLTIRWFPGWLDDDDDAGCSEGPVVEVDCCLKCTIVAIVLGLAAKPATLV